MDNPLKHVSALLDKAEPLLTPDNPNLEKAAAILQKGADILNSLTETKIAQFRLVNARQEFLVALCSLYQNYYQSALSAATLAVTHHPIHRYLRLKSDIERQIAKFKQLPALLDRAEAIQNGKSPTDSSLFAPLKHLFSPPPSIRETVYKLLGEMRPLIAALPLDQEHRN
jgi:hypothetical protein